MDDQLWTHDTLVFPRKDNAQYGNAGLSDEVAFRTQSRNCLPGAGSAGYSQQVNQTHAE